MSKKFGSLCLAVVACFLLLPSVALGADSFAVYVGYADNLRASGFFPSPWLGATNVVSESASSQSFDTGAIRIDNTGATAITITGLTVKFNGGSPAISIWSPLTIGPGQIGIFTQTTAYNFDSSDFGIFGGLPPASLYPTIAGNNQIGGCSSTASILTASGDAALCSANAPVVSFLENGNPFSATDTGQILNTGGWDFVNNGTFGEDGNESINWNLIGSTASRGGTNLFSAFCVTLEVSHEEHKKFELHSRFMLAPNNGAIDPPNETVTLQIGSFSTTIPSNSFRKTEDGSFHFDGEIDSVPVDVRITSHDSNSYGMKVRVKGVDLSGLADPISVVLTIGNSTGTTAAFREREDEGCECDREH
jgi:hypothetical protein